MNKWMDVPFLDKQWYCTKSTFSQYIIFKINDQPVVCVCITLLYGHICQPIE